MAICASSDSFYKSAGCWLLAPLDGMLMFTHDFRFPLNSDGRTGRRQPMVVSLGKMRVVKHWVSWLLSLLIFKYVHLSLSKLIIGKPPHISASCPVSDTA